jgi:LysR family transcriptional activator of nhaA
VIAKEIRGQYKVLPVGHIDSIIERFYAISVERRLKHAAVVRISDTARETLFGESENPI